MTTLLMPEYYVDNAFDASPLKREDFCSVHELLVHTLDVHPARTGGGERPTDQERYDALRKAATEALDILTIAYSHPTPLQFEGKDLDEYVLCAAILMHVDRAISANDDLIAKAGARKGNYIFAERVYRVARNAVITGDFQSDSRDWRPQAQYLVLLEGVVKANQYIEKLKNPDIHEVDINQVRSRALWYRRPQFKATMGAAMGTLLLQRLDEAQAFYQARFPHSTGATVTPISRFSKPRPPTPGN